MNKEPLYWYTTKTGKHIAVYEGEDKLSALKRTIKEQKGTPKEAIEQAKQSSKEFTSKYGTGGLYPGNLTKEEYYKQNKSREEKNNKLYKNIKEQDNSDFENKYLKAHKEPSLQNSKDYESFSNQYAKKYGENERTKMFNHSQESRKREIEGNRLNDEFKNKTPKQKARMIDKANGKKDYYSMTKKQLAEELVNDQIKRGVVNKENKQFLIDKHSKSSKSELLKYFK